MVNPVNVNRVADAIENGELVKRGIGFNMAAWREPVHGDVIDRTGHHCKTVACIGGTVDILFLTGTDRGRENKLGLSPDQFLRLVAPMDAHPWRDITPAHAVSVLRHLAETGEVDWSVGAP